MHSHGKGRSWEDYCHCCEGYACLNYVLCLLSCSGLILDASPSHYTDLVLSLHSFVIRHIIRHTYFIMCCRPMVTWCPVGKPLCLFVPTIHKSFCSKDMIILSKWPCHRITGPWIIFSMVLSLKHYLFFHYWHNQHNNIFWHSCLYYRL